MDNFDMNLTEDQTEKVLQFQVGLAFSLTSV